MSCSSLQPWAHSNLIQYEYDDGICFRVGFLGETGIAISGLSFKDDSFKLLFKPSPKVPNITEEDIAVVAKLVLEDKSPSFYYKGFHPGHPFAGKGRLYKSHDPPWLRGTSVGETEAETDWKMKCLHIGVECNANKTKLRVINKTSNLTGLKTRQDFNEEIPGATIVMEFESVDVEIDEENEEIHIVGNPCPRIHCVYDGINSQYAEYATTHFESIAFHEEPLFLKMQEIVKLFVIMKYLKKQLDKKGLTFSQTWIDEHLEKRHERQSERIEVKVSPQQIEEAKSKQLTLPEFFESSLAEKEVKITGNVLGVETEIVARASYNNYDFLLQDEDPNQPTDFEKDETTGELKPLVPDVKSWNELFSQTVPQPCTALYTDSGHMGPFVTGGVTTRNLTTRETRRQHRPTEELIPVSANTPLKKLKTPKPNGAVIPPSNVGAPTPKNSLKKAFQNSGIHQGAGFCDSRGFKILSEDGKQVVAQDKKLECFIGISTGEHPAIEFDCPHEVRELRRDGTRGPKIKLHKQLLPPQVAKTRNLADECTKNR